MKHNSDSVFHSEKNYTKKSSPFFVKLMLPMTMLTVFQLMAFVLVFFLGGEFSYIKKYAYNIFTEKTENRKSYVENMLNQKTSLVYETAGEVNEIVAGILADENKSYEDISKDKELNKKIISDTAESLIYLLRRDMVNDAFIILDTGELYFREEKHELAGIYIRDIDETGNKTASNQDLLMQMGSSDIANELGIVLDFEWSSRIDISDNSDGDFDFYINTVENARKYPEIAAYNLGYWSGFSKISNSAAKSMKYTFPLISDDGTVYGVIGVGLMEKTILKNMPANDFLSEKACYIIGADFNGDNHYSVLTHSGPVFERLVDENTIISTDVKIEREIYDFNSDSSMETIGNIQEMNIYNSGSPYKHQKWALISIAEKASILNIYTKLIQILILSGLMSMFFSVVCAIFINRRMTAPVTRIIHTLNENNKSNNIIQFESSNINEIDQLANAIIVLQINVKEYSSRVSKIISMADMGIGVFMYDCNAGTVFVGESLIKLFGFRNLIPEDTVISFEEFKSYIGDVDKENIVCSNSIFQLSNSNESLNTSVELLDHNPKTKTSRWFKFTLTRGNNNVIGLVQDVTKSVIEKKKIEYERDYDITTGLLNRRAYYNKIDEMFSEPEKLKTAAFVMWDLDNLKYVNDTYGHDFGDDYIKTAANIFKLFRDYNGVVARMSGDEFNIFLSGFDTKEQIWEIITEIREKLMNSYCILADGTHYKIRASGGVSWYPDDSKSYELLIKYADFAMYTIKHSTKGYIAEFDLSSYSKDSILITGVEEMNRIIDERSIKYAFHSIVNAKTGEIYGFEALMRPQSDVLKSPLEFIRIARTGAKLYEIERLTWLLGIESFKEQIRTGNIPENSKLFINSLSNCIITEVDIELIEKEYKDILPNVVMEILESEKSNSEYTMFKQQLIAKWGGKIALDDFGSGYNNEYALITFNPNIIKIDRSIISGCDSDISRRSIVSNLIQLANTKGITVLAEGVETYSEMKTVIECGVDLLQGYYLNRPLFEPQPISPEIVKQIREINNN